jgi:iron complex transport system ATP-binding protein
VVKFDNVGHAYHPSQWLFQGYNVDVKLGSIFAVLGPNGAGKTTLLKILLGALKPAAGSVKVDGQVAFVPQLFEVTFDYSVLDMVLMGRVRQIGLFSQPSSRDRKIALAALDRFGMAGFARHSFQDLSGGERQLVIFARALVSEPAILILDEPTSALDLKNQMLILDWITRLSRQDGLTVVLTTHHPHHALAIADEVLLMLGGTKYATGPTAEVLNEKNLHALYGVDIRLVLFEHKGKMRETLVPVLPDSSLRDESRHLLKSS